MWGAPLERDDSVVTDLEARGAGGLRRLGKQRGSVPAPAPDAPSWALFLLLLPDTPLLPTSQALETIASYTSQQGDGGHAAAAPAPSRSADPELWQAIMNSLEETSAAKAHQLQRHLSDVSPELAGRLRDARSAAERVDTACGVTYFDGGAAAEAGATSPRSGGAGDCGLVLPSFAGYPPAVREAVLSQLCNSYLQREAEQVRQQGGSGTAAQLC